MGRSGGAKATPYFDYDKKSSKENNRFAQGMVVGFIIALILALLVATERKIEIL